MGHKRKRKFKKDDKDQPNLKRFRHDITKLAHDSAPDVDRRNDNVHEKSSAAVAKGGGKQVSRKQRRKEERKFKKARRFAHSQGQKVHHIVTYDSPIHLGGVGGGGW